MFYSENAILTSNFKINFWAYLYCMFYGTHKLDCTFLRFQLFVRPVRLHYALLQNLPISLLTNKKFPMFLTSQTVHCIFSPEWHAHIRSASVCASWQIFHVWGFCLSNLIPVLIYNGSTLLIVRLTAFVTPVLFR